MKVSIIIPTFNSAPYIGDALESIRKQNYSHIEVIIIDNKSEDETLKICNTYIGLLEIKIFSESDNGQLDAVRKGLKIASGDTIMWLNSDDFILPSCFTRASRYIDAGYDYVYSDALWCDEKVHKCGYQNPVRFINFWEYFRGYRQIQVECLIFKKSILDTSREININYRLYTDFSVWLGIIKRGKGIWMPEPMGCFRIRSGQISASSNQFKSEKDQIILEHLNDLKLSSKNLDIALKGQRFSSLACSSYQKIKKLNSLLLRLLFFGLNRRRLANIIREKWLSPESTCGDFSSYFMIFGHKFYY